MTHRYQMTLQYPGDPGYTFADTQQAGAEHVALYRFMKHYEEQRGKLRRGEGYRLTITRSN